MRSYNIGIVGTLGVVGSEIIKILLERSFPINDIKFFGSNRSEGQEYNFNNQKYIIEAVKEGSFNNIDIVFFAAGAETSSKYAEMAASEGAIVIDNSSFWRMNPKVPLVIPEVNPDALKNHNGIIANPNCSTIQMLLPLKPIHDKYVITRVVVSTYQAVSGTGKNAIEELKKQAEQYINNDNIDAEVYPHQILFNALPHIDIFLDNGYTKEEIKMVDETKKILDENIVVSPTAVRIPVFIGHSESINIETKMPVNIDDIKNLLNNSSGVKVYDDPSKNVYPLALVAQGKDDVFVGRIRKDISKENGINIWVVGDNLRKGAALNAVQIAEKLVEMNLV